MRTVKWRRLLWRGLRVGLVVLVGFVAYVLVDGWTAFGRSADGRRRARMEASPNWRDGHFVNPQPLSNDLWGALTAAFHTSEYTSPRRPIAPVPTDRRLFRKQPITGLRVTWLGHSTLLVEIDGVRLLTDPVWSERVSPLTWMGPRRFYPPPLPLHALPRIDAVVISHDHYDHLDQPTLVAMRAWNSKFVVPLGVGAHLAYWGITEKNIVELDWWQRTRIGGIEVVCTPARHASGRFPPFDNDAKLWASYAFVGPTRRAYFSGDTGLFPAMKDIGARLGPFDVTMIEVGQYHGTWPDWHIGPEQAVKAHGLLRGKVMLPIHWALFALAYHGWTEPAERVVAASHETGATIALPRPGQSFEPADVVPTRRWWPKLPWDSAAVAPIVSTRNP